VESSNLSPVIRVIYFPFFFELALVLDYQKRVSLPFPCALGWYFAGRKFQLFMAGFSDGSSHFTVERLFEIDINSFNECLGVLRIFSKIRQHGLDLLSILATIPPPRLEKKHKGGKQEGIEEKRETGGKSEKEKEPKDGSQQYFPQSSKHSYTINTIHKLHESSRNKIYLVSVGYPGKEVVIKKYFDKNAFSTEEELLQDLRGVQGVVQIRKEFIPLLSDLGLKYAIPLQYGGIPYECPGSFSELCLYIYKLFKILDNCHKIGIVHCDIKIPNVLYNSASQKVTVIDWEFAWQFDITDNTTFYWMGGTRGYQAPEVVHCRECCSKIDVWSAGILFLNLVLGTHIKDFNEALEIVQLGIKQIKEDYPCSVFLSEEGLDLARTLLKFWPKERPSFECVLTHPYFALMTGGTSNKK